MGNPFEKPKIPKSKEGKINKKMIFSNPELGINVEAESADEAQMIFEKIKMQRDKDVRNAIDSTPKSENMEWQGVDRTEHKYFVESMTEELKTGDSTKALNYCLSQSLNDREQNYTESIKKLRNWQLKMGKAESLASIDLAISFLKRLGDEKEGTWGREIIDLIKKNKLNEALGVVGEALVDTDRRIVAFEAGLPKYKDFSDKYLKDEKFRKNILERVRDTLFAQMSM